MTPAAETRDTKQSGRVVSRWIAVCGDIESPSFTSKETAPCGWGERKDPKRHLTSDAAVREARDHAVEAGHVGAREVQVRRLFKPRELEREEIIS